MTESRAAHRHRVLKAGAIEFSGGGAISCAVKNLSASGAALEVVSALDIPDRLISVFLRSISSGTVTSSGATKSG
jgi:hypothetical protein